MPHIGSHGLSHESNPSGGYAQSIAAALCGAEVARGGKPHAGEHEVSRVALPPAFSFGEGCNGRGKQAAVRCGITLPLPRSASRTDGESRSEAAAVIRGTPCPSAAARLFRRKFFDFEKRTRLNRLAQASPRLLHL